MVPIIAIYHYQSNEASVIYLHTVKCKYNNSRTIHFSKSTQIKSQNSPFSTSSVKYKHTV